MIIQSSAFCGLQVKIIRIYSSMSNLEFYIIKFDQINEVEGRNEVYVKGTVYHIRSTETKLFVQYLVS